MAAVKQSANGAALDSSNHTKQDDTKQDDGGEKRASGAEDRALNRISLRINTARCVTVCVILVVTFTPVVVLSFPFPWTTPQAVYAGPVCARELLNLQNDSRNQSTLAVLSGVELTGREKEVAWALRELDAVNASHVCVEELRLWLCVDLFSTEGCVGSSIEDWETRVYTCPQDTVQLVLESSLYLRDCVPQNLSDTGEIVSEPNTIECSQDFFFDNDSKRCVPECGRWFYTSHSQERTLTLLSLTGTLLGILITTLFLVGSGIKHKQMLKFPSIFLVYAIITLLVNTCLSFLTLVDRETIVCSSKNLLENLEKQGASFFCQLVGALSLYGRIQVVIWWLSHTAVLTYGVYCPMRYQTAKISGHLKYFHVGLISAALLAPLIPVLAQLFLGGYGIDVGRNYECVPLDESSVEVVPIGIAGSVTLVMLIMIGSRIYELRKRGLATGDGYLVEIKVSIVLSISFFAFILLAGSDTLHLWAADTVSSDIHELFRCESRGKIDGMVCSRDAFDSTYSIIETTNHIMRCIIPAAFVVFLINFRSVKKSLLVRKRQLTQMSTRVTLLQTSLRSK